MQSYLIIFLTGGIIGFLATKLFAGRGFGLTSNIIAGAAGGYIGYMYLAEYLHSFESMYSVYIFSGSVGAILAIFVVMFCFSHDT